MSIDWSRPLRNKRGEAATLVSTTDHYDFPREVTWYCMESRRQRRSGFTQEGKYWANQNTPEDLENVPEEKTLSQTFDRSFTKDSETPEAEAAYTADELRRARAFADQCGGAERAADILQLLKEIS